MRIDRFDLISFGHFTNKSLNFSKSKKEDFHVIYGDNEKGKSTSLRALSGLLFGIPNNSPDDFLHDSKNLRIGGKLCLKDGATLEFIRKKGRTKTLLDYYTNTVLRENVLSGFIPVGVDQTVFHRLWGLSYQDLIDGGRELLDGSGDLGRALYSAALGMSGIQDLVKELEKQLEGLFTPRGRIPRINKNIKEYSELNKKVKDSSVHINHFQRLEDQIKELNDRLNQIDQQIQLDQAQLSSYKRVGSISEPLSYYRRLSSELAKIEQVILLPENFLHRYQTAQKKVYDANSELETLDTKLQALEKQKAKVNLRTDILENEQKIVEIQENIGASGKIIEEIPKLESKCNNLSAKIVEKCLEKLGSDSDDLEKWRPLLIQKSPISKLVNQYNLFQQRKKDCQVKCLEMEKELNSSKHKLSGLSNKKLDLSHIQAVVKPVLKAGDIESQLTKAKTQYQRDLNQYTDELKRLGRYKGSIYSLLSLTLPSYEFINQGKKKYDQIDKKLNSVEKELEKLINLESKDKRKLNRLVEGKDITTIDQLKDSRDHRDQQWTTIKDQVIFKDRAEKDLDKEQLKAKVYDFEKKIKSSDLIADKLFLQSKIINQKHTLITNIEEHAAQIAELKNRLDELLQEKDKFNKFWDNKWSEVGIKASTPDEMNVWLSSINSLYKPIERLVCQKQEIETLTKECKKHRDTVIKQIDKFDHSVDSQSMTLSSLVSLYEQLVEKYQNDQQKLDQTKDNIDHQLENLIDVNKQKDLIEVQINQCLTSFKHRVQGLSPGLTSPDQFSEVIEEVEVIFKLKKDLEDTQILIVNKTNQKQFFEKKVIFLSKSLGFDLDQDITVLCRSLKQSLEQAQKDQVQITQLSERIVDVCDSIEKKQKQIKQLNNQFKIWRSQAQVKNNQDLLGAGELSNQKRSVQTEIENKVQELFRHGDGKSLDELQKEYDHINIDTLESEINLIKEKLKELKDQRDQLRDQRTLIQSEKDRIKGDSKAADLAYQASQCAAQIESDVQRYIRLQTALLMLKDQIDRFRKTHQAPILKKSSLFFSRLTKGSFKELANDFVGTKPIIVGVKKNGQRVTIEKMSTGSRDQLFLALRLAMVENHLHQSKPLPFVLDDVLIGFDDSRSEVCIEILKELSTKTQVLLFTHHSRIVQIVNDIFDFSQGVCHDLSEI